MLSSRLQQKHFGSHTNTRYDEKILSIDRSKMRKLSIEQNTERPLREDDIVVEELEVATIGSGVGALLRLFREL